MDPRGLWKVLFFVRGKKRKKEKTSECNLKKVRVKSKWSYRKTLQIRLLSWKHEWLCWVWGGWQWTVWYRWRFSGECRQHWLTLIRTTIMHYDSLMLFTIPCLLSHERLCSATFSLHILKTFLFLHKCDCVCARVCVQVSECVRDQSVRECNVFFLNRQMASFTSVD